MLARNLSGERKLSAQLEDPSLDDLGQPLTGLNEGFPLLAGVHGDSSGFAEFV